MMSFCSIPMRVRATYPLVPTFRSLSLSSCLDNPAAAAPKTTIPKRPPTPWLRFYTDNLPLVKSAQPNTKITEIMKQLSSKWKLLGENQKNQYLSAYEKEKEIYQKKLSKIPESALAEASQVSAKKRAAKLKMKAQSELTDLLISLKKPATQSHSSYLAYFTARQPQMKEKGILGKEAVHLIAKEWNAMTDLQKLPYARKVEAASEKYKKDLEIWTNKMNKMGKLEMIMDAKTKLAMAKKKLKEFDA